MATYLALSIQPNHIDANTWAEAFDETVAMLEAWRPRLLGFRSRQFEGHDVVVLSSSILSDDGQEWCVVGDRESMSWAESKRVRRDLSHYGRGEESSDRDIVLEKVDEADDLGCCVNVFRDGTQGFPHHYAVLAAGMVFEERFAPHAIVSGDIDREDAEKARKMAAPLLGRELPLPVLVDASHLVERLRPAFGEDLATPFHRVYRGEGNGYEAILRAFPGDAGTRIWLRALRNKRTLKEVGLNSLITAWVLAGRDLSEACRLACIHPEGPKLSVNRMIDALVNAWDGGSPEPREPIATPTQPPRTPPAIIGAFLLDAVNATSQRQIQISPEALEAMLTSVFGEDGSKHFRKLKRRRAKSEKDWAEITGSLRTLLERASGQPDDDTESVLVAESVDELGEPQRMWVEALGWQVAKAWEQFRGNPKLAPVLADAALAKKTIAASLARGQPTLTEDAWEAMMAETDNELLAFFVALAGLRPDDVHGSRIRRALFENAQVRAYAFAFARDDVRLRKFEKRIGALRRAQTAS